MSEFDIAAIQSAVRGHSDEIVTFLRQICAIPSLDSQIGPVGERVQAEMRKLGFDEVWFDSMGNTVGRIGDGQRVLVYDSHIDTVGIGAAEEWDWDPFEGKVEDGIFYARGACDEKGSTPGMIYRHGHRPRSGAAGRLDSLLLRQYGGVVRWHRAARLRRA